MTRTSKQQGGPDSHSHAYAFRRVSTRREAFALKLLRKLDDCLEMAPPPCIPSPLLRLVFSSLVFPLPSCDWFPLTSENSCGWCTRRSPPRRPPPPPPAPSAARPVPPGHAHGRPSRCPPAPSAAAASATSSRGRRSSRDPRPGLGPGRPQPPAAPNQRGTKPNEPHRPQRDGHLLAQS
eukprot:1180427-Prorocentrum_minimum.AAC.3